MANRTYYQQHPGGDGPYLRPPTLTVGELVAQLATFDPDLPVIYRMPTYGVFGAGVTNAIGDVTREQLPATGVTEPAGEIFDEEAGEWHQVDEEHYTLPAWDGVVLA